VKQGAELCGRVLLHVGQHRSVGVQRHPDLAVAEPLADDVHRLPGLQRQRRARVPQTVKLDRAHAGGVDERGVLGWWRRCTRSNAAVSAPIDTVLEAPVFVGPNVGAGPGTRSCWTMRTFGA